MYLYAMSSPHLGMMVSLFATAAKNRNYFGGYACSYQLTVHMDMQEHALLAAIAIVMLERVTQYVALRSLLLLAIPALTPAQIMQPEVRCSGLTTTSRSRLTGRSVAEILHEIALLACETHAEPQHPLLQERL
ncbi:hypothetical protein DPSP01_003029 [Paraphaeosphaeria sporulosa]